MNQKLIDQLLHKAGARFGAEGTDYSSFTSSKFAELIVAKCVSIVDDAERGGSNEIWDNAVKFIRRDLQEHFGVEE